ncbi:hypothetical protein SSX86_001793 [Deinandra increscens subsp. villosa]|uniref:Gag protein n=1 Tax=Deinandra increscens subsp. villosa TaxID=3103831 RepID=A0AAP0DVL6_9ASTR
MADSSHLTKFNSALHSLRIPLTPNNYLAWQNQMTPIFEHQGLTSHIDGSSPQPPATIESEGTSEPNPEYVTWKDAEQKAIILIHTSLSEEVFPEIVGYSTAKEKWDVLAAAYSNSSVERAQNLKDQVNTITKGSLSIAEFGRRFKSLTDQLAAIGQPMSELDKTHAYYRGLGPDYLNFAIALKAAQPNITLRELQARAENTEIFSKSLHGSSSSAAAAFLTQGNRTNGSNRSFSNRSRNGNRNFCWYI